MKKEVEKTNLNVMAYEQLHKTFKNEYWFAVNYLTDKDFVGLTEKEEEFIKIHNELITLIVDNIRLKAKIKGDLSDEEIEKWCTEFLLIYLISKENAEIIRNRVDIGCPICRTKLVYVKRMRAETLNEHVCPDEHGYISKKDMYGCPNEGCEVHKSGLLWIGDGEGYYGPYNRDNDKLPFIDGNHAPFRTFSRKMEAEKEQKIFELKIFKRVMIRFSVTSKADQNGKRHWNKNLYLRLAFGSGDGCYTYYQSGLHMFIFSMKQYAKKYGRIHKFKDKTRWPDKRWWARLSFWVASKIWHKDYLKSLEK